MADSWWDAIFNPQGLRDYHRVTPRELPLDRLENPADNKEWWYGNKVYGEMLNPNELGIYGTPQPPGTPKVQPEGRDVVLPSRPSQPFLDRSIQVERYPDARLGNELWKRSEAGQLGDKEAYKGFMANPAADDQDRLESLRGQGNSYLTRISDNGGAAPPNEVRGLRGDDEFTRRFNQQEGEDEGLIHRFNQLEGEPNRSRFQAYRDWQQQASPEELRDQALEGGYRTPSLPMPPPGYAEDEMMPPSPMQQRGYDEILKEKLKLMESDEPGREEGLLRALHGARSGLPRSESVEDLKNFMLGEQIRSEGGGAAPPVQSNALANVVPTREPLNELEKYIMQQLEYHPDIPFGPRNDIPQEQLTEWIMRKYNLADTEAARRHAADYAAQLRVFSNPEDYRNLETEGLWGDRTPEESRRGYQPISDVRPQQIEPEGMPYRRPPLASGIAPLPNARGFDPLIDVEGSMNPFGRRRERSPFSGQGMYRRTIPF